MSTGKGGVGVEIEYDFKADLNSVTDASGGGRTPA